MRYNRFFNWSMTYRSDADIPFIYGLIKQKNNSASNGRMMMKIPRAIFTEISREEILAFKHSSASENVKGNRSATAAVVAWMASHCPTHGKRESYIRQLKRS